MDPATLMSRLATETIAAFPSAMDGPLVAAGICVPGADVFLCTGTNVMRLAEPTGYRAVHAEEAALDGLKAIDEPGSIDVVVSLEPCTKRQGETDACSTRICALNRRLRVRRVIVGALADGKGLLRLGRSGVSVVLLDSDEHRARCPDVDVDSVITKLNATLRNERREPVFLARVARLDDLNRETYRRKGILELEQTGLRRELVRVIQTSIQAGANVTDELIRLFPAIFDEEDRNILNGIMLPTERAAFGGLSMMDAWLQQRVWVFQRRRCAKRVEIELRGE